MYMKISFLEKLACGISCLRHRVIALGLLLSAPALLSAQDVLPLIPQPVQVTTQPGVFVVGAGTNIVYPASQRELEPAAAWLAEALGQLSGRKPGINAGGVQQVELQLQKSLPSEGYILRVQEKSILIQAGGYGGIFYGMQTLLQTLPAIRTNAPLAIPCMEVKDEPRFAWRGMHLDVSRHFFSVELVKQYIDLMASYKMNRFHWHLVDDPGWRMEIKQYPKLTAVGAWRVDHTDKPWGSRPQAQPGEKPTYGGYYTQDQLRDIVAYAARRNVTIVPEIEMPGHVASAIAAYPHLSCSQKPQLPLTGGNYTGMSSNYCAGSEEVFRFLENVLTEVLDIFPSKYIHIGGDEVDKGPWRSCARCQQRMKDEGLKNEEELQSYFIRRMERFLGSRQRRLIGWDEILEGGLAPGATVMSWRGEAGGIEAANMHHDVVMTPGSPCYFDHYQAGPEGEPLAIGGMNTLKKVYDYEPIPAELPAANAKYVLGAQANLWTEFVTTASQVEYMVLPRMLALAEVVWSPRQSRNWSSFSQRLQTHFRAFDQKGLTYSKGNFKVAIQPQTSDGRLQAALSTEIPGASIHYTLDGTDPDAKSSLYSAPVPITGSATLKAVTVVRGEVMGWKPAGQQFVMHQAVGRPVTYKNPVSRYYMADGPNSLTDGIRGNLSVGKFWHGFSGTDLVATIDLGAAQTIRKVALGAMQRYNDWIFMPKWVKFEVSDDGQQFTELAVVPNGVAADEKTPVIRNFETVFQARKARFIRVHAKVLDACPPGHPGAGKPAWLFADEIVVE